jgi:hypothetical protein
VTNVLSILMATIPLPNVRNYETSNSILLEEWEEGGEAQTNVKAKDARKENKQHLGTPLPLQKANMARETKAKLRHWVPENLSSLAPAVIVASSGTWPETATNDNKEQHQSPSNKIQPMSTVPNPQHTN